MIFLGKIVLNLRPAAELQGWNSKERIVAVHVTDTQSQDVVTAKHLGGIKKVVITVRGYIIISKGHKGNFSLIHQVCKMAVGNG